MNKSVSDTTYQRMTRFARESPFLASLRTRLMLLVLLALLPALGLIIYTAVERRQQGMEEAKQSALRVVRSAAAQQDQLVESSRQLLATLAQLKEVQNRNGVACQEILTNLLALHSVYANIAVADLTGNVVASGVPIDQPVSVGDRAYFRAVKETGEFAIGEYQVGRLTKKATLNLGFPVRNQERELTAVVYAALDLRWLNQMMTNLNLPPNSSLTVMDRNGVTLVRYPDERFVGQELRIRPRTGAITVTRESVRILRSRDGTMRLYARTTLGGQLESNPPWISVGIPLSVAYAAADEMLSRNVLFIGVVAVLTLAAAWFGGNFMILRRVRSLARAAGRLSTGDLRARSESDYGRGELGQLARVFDEMAASLEQKSADRDRAQADLRLLNQDLENRVAARTTELRRSNEDLDQFAAVASHDLQEPLRMVTNYLQLLEQRYASHLDDKAREFIGFATDGAGRMQGLIRDLLAYSRVSTKPYDFEETALEDMLARALANLKLALEESKGVVTHDRLPVVTGVPLLLSQLFQNLISNAIKFRGPESPRIHISVQPGRHEWTLAVRDNGIGIPVKDFDRVFVIFQRLHSREKYPGTGIGLSVCKKIVERHGGRIWVESVAGQGTTFYFTLSKAPAPSDHSRGTSRPADMATAETVAK